MEPASTDGLPEPGSESFQRVTTTAMGALIAWQGLRERATARKNDAAANLKQTQQNRDQAAQDQEQVREEELSQAGPADTAVDPRDPADLPERNALLRQWEEARLSPQAPGSTELMSECERQLRAVDPDLMAAYDSAIAAGEEPAAAMGDAMRVSAATATPPAGTTDPQGAADRLAAGHEAAAGGGKVNSDALDDDAAQAGDTPIITNDNRMEGPYL